jgi:hypothetical protein
MRFLSGCGWLEVQVIDPFNNRIRFMELKG